MIRVEGLCAGFGKFRLRDVELAVDPGQSFLLLGPSGSGKTLLLEAILGIRPLEAGRVLLDGVDATRLPPEARKVAYVPQDLALFPHLDVRGNLLFGLRMRGVEPREAAARLARWAELLDLGAVLDRPDVATLSGGERQRVALARALVTEPQVLFMDEPFSALDASLRRRLQTEVRSLQRRLGLTLVQVTHEAEEAFLMADRMAILMDGRVEQWGTPAALYNRPANLKVARFLMLQNLDPGRVLGLRADGLAEVAVEGGRFVLEADPRYGEGAPVVVGIRPEEVMLIRPDRPVEPERVKNLFCGTVEEWSDLGHYRLVRLRVGPLVLDSWLNIRAAREFPMEPGGRMWFHLRPGSFCLLPPQ
ncbi:MAG TPA: ABC transporter ATP-binding protein [Deferrisomatales bacterium]|nr:ABC transporter ATP-binding protein [Deferrisomatales bacterium]